MRAVFPLMIGVFVASSHAATVTFDDVASLGEYTAQGITFSSNISFWQIGNSVPTVLEDPNGGAVSNPNGICVGPCGTESGSIYFDFDVENVSIYALSGPSDDPLNSGVEIRAYDLSDNLLGTATADPLLQFDQLTIAAVGIRRLELISPVLGGEAWDELSYTVTPVPLPGALALMLPGALVLRLRRK
ncbi:MAG: hypothetical protein H6978_00945 [Gammaproteobacteria bacterium]|nr:hypothetical protein [Gammaproteobacteria bacterium]